MARCTLLALLLPAAHALSIARRDAIKAAPPAFLLASRPAWARYDDYKDGPRGLKYIVTEPGTGATPQRGQSVKAEYTLTLDGFSEDGGRVVDSSKGFMKGPFAFYAGTGGVIKGWDLVRRRVSHAFLFARASRRWHAGDAVGTRLRGGASVMRRTSDRSEHFHAIAAVQTRAQTTVNTTTTRRRSWR